MKILKKLIYYSNIIVVVTALFFAFKSNSNAIFAILIPGFSQPFFALILLAVKDYTEKKIFQLLQWYWIGVAVSLATLVIYGIGIIVGVFLIFYFTYVTYKFQKENYSDETQKKP